MSDDVKLYKSDMVAWRNAMSNDGKLYKSICGQDHDTEQFNISDQFTDVHHHQGEMHCIELRMPGTY
eukprot:scaffold180007_cov28-Attheya_sp.AAC.1